MSAEERASYRFRAYPFPNDEGPGIRWSMVAVPEDEKRDIFDGAELRLKLPASATQQDAKALAGHLNRQAVEVALRSLDHPSRR